MGSLPLSLVFLLILTAFSVYADESKDVSNEETIAQLKLTLSDLSNSHRKLCDEMALLSQYVALHERALQVTLRSHEWKRHPVHTHHSHQNEENMSGHDSRKNAPYTNGGNESAHPSLTKPETPGASDEPLQGSNETVNLTTSSSIDHLQHANRQHDHHHINHQDNLIDSSQWISHTDWTSHHTRGRTHQRQLVSSSHIHLRGHDGHSKVNVSSVMRKSLPSMSSIDNYADQVSINSTETSENEKNVTLIAVPTLELSGGENGSTNHPSKRSNDWSDSLIIPQYIQEMESSIANDNNGSDFIYATCEVQANRAISLLLQQNIQGRINLWQRKDSSGPVYAYIKLSGFRVTSDTSRARRETVLMPVETSARDAEKPLDAAIANVSREHAFHVHTSGDLSRSCQSTGPHFNASSPNNGSSSDTFARLMGDLGNLKCKGDGTIDTEYTYPHVSLLGANSIIGKSLVIHSAPDIYTGGERVDDATSSPNDSRVRIACCVVQPVVNLPQMDDSPSLIGSSIVSPEQINNQGGK